MPEPLTPENLDRLARRMYVAHTFEVSGDALMADTTWQQLTEVARAGWRAAAREALLFLVTLRA